MDEPDADDTPFEIEPDQQHDRAVGETLGLSHIPGREDVTGDLAVAIGSSGGRRALDRADPIRTGKDDGQDLRGQILRYSFTGMRLFAERSSGGKRAGRGKASNQREKHQRLAPLPSHYRPPLVERILSRREREGPHPSGGEVRRI